MALQGLPQRNLHQFILWKVAPSRMLVPEDQEWLQIRGKVLLCTSSGWWTTKWKVHKEWWQKCSSHFEVEWLARKRMAPCCQPWHLSWVETRTYWTLIIDPHDNWVVSFKTWSRRSLFYGRAQTCRNQSNVWNSRKLLHVTLKFETKILRSDFFAQVNLISAAPTLQNLRIGLRRRQSGKSKVPAKQRGSWPKVY